MPFDNFTKPIFIIAAPRSGSTFLFECLMQFKELFHISYEADYIWWRYFPFERLEDPSDYIGNDEATTLNIFRLRRALRSRATMNKLKLGGRLSHVPFYLGLKPIRYLDKTIANCFHLEFIEKAFPDAQYIFLLRDPRAVISSMIEGWEQPFQKPQLKKKISNTQSATIQHWTFPAAPGWDKVIAESLPRICAWSWIQHIKYSLSFFERQSENVHLVRYEALVENTYSTVGDLAGRLDLNMSGRVAAYLKNPRMSSTTVSAPALDKWKEQRKSEIVSIVPMIADLANKIGYDLDRE